MRRVKLTRCFGGRQDIVRNLAPTNQHGVDTEVEVRFLLQRILRCKGIDDKLEIRGGFGRFLAQASREAEKLDIVDDDTPLEQRHDLETGSQAGYFEHILALTVVQLHIFNDNTIEKAYIHMSDGNLTIEQVLQLLGYYRRQFALNRGGVQKQPYARIKSQARVGNNSEEIFKASTKSHILNGKANIQISSDYTQYSSTFFTTFIEKNV